MNDLNGARSIHPHERISNWIYGESSFVVLRFDIDGDEDAVVMESLSFTQISLSMFMRQFVVELELKLY